MFGSRETIAPKQAHPVLGGGSGRPLVVDKMGVYQRGLKDSILKPSYGLVGCKVRCDSAAAVTCSESHSIGWYRMKRQSSIMSA
jgi:hypothetical protein